MISGIFGLPGSGKSLLLGKIAHDCINGKSPNTKGLYIKKHCKDIKKVYTNFPCEGAYKLDFESLGKAYYHDCIILIDEVQLLADSRNYKTFGENLKQFFSQHRKYGVDLCYASQTYMGADKKIRDLTDHLYYIDDWYFNIMRIREIVAYFDVKGGEINEGYDYASGLNTVYFFRKKFYRYVDTLSIILDQVDRTNEPSELWYDFDKIGRIAAEKAAAATDATA